MDSYWQLLEATTKAQGTAAEKSRQWKEDALLLLEVPLHCSTFIVACIDFAN